MTNRIKEVYQETLDMIIVYCDNNKKAKDCFRGPDLGLPHGHTRALFTRGRIDKVSRANGVTEWRLIRSAC